jgi:putative endonuclease
MTYKSQIGKLGEDLACKYLINEGYTIIERNFRRKWGEIDIIAKNPANILVFAEIKTMQSGNPAMRGKHCRIAELPDSLKPEDQLTVAKYKKLKRTSELYIGFHQELIDENRGWQIDLIAIDIYADDKYSIRHYENI